MAYKQNPGRSPFLKTGRGIPLNFLQNSPLKETEAEKAAREQALIDASDKAFAEYDAANTDNTKVDDSETEVMPIDKDATGERSTFSTNIGDYALNTKGRRDEYTRRGWAQDDTTVLTPTGGGDTGGKVKSDKITKGKDLVTEGKATKKAGRKLKREGRRDDRIKKAKGKISNITGKKGEGKILTEKEQWKVKKQQKKVKNIEAKQKKKKK